MNPAPQRSKRAARMPRGRNLVIVFVVVLLLLIAGWAGLTHWQLVRSSQHFDAGDYEAAEDSANTFLGMSPFEEHKGHFAIGTARAADGDLEVAEEELALALSTAPPLDECAVRINLALVQEQQGNELRDAEDVDAANERYDSATATLEAAPEECRPSGSSTDERMAQQEERVGESQEQMNNPQEPGDGDEGDGDGDSDSGGDGGQQSGGSGSGGQSGGSSGDDDSGSQGGSGGDEPDPGESDEETEERLEELDERRRESEQRHSESSGGGSGSGVREPGSKPW